MGNLKVTRPVVASPAYVTAARLDKDPLKADFRNFMHKAWMTWFDNAPTENMYEFGWRLQHGPPRDILMGFRGFSKSFITVTFGIWTLYVDPKEIVLTVSGSGSGAAGNADLAWGMVNNFPWLAHMKPTGNLRQSAEAFDVQGSMMEKSESFAAMSLFGQTTGRRGSLIIPDDIETPNTSETEGDRSKLRKRNKELGGAILKPGGRIKMLGTAQTEHTIYTELATESGYGCYILPCRYPISSTDPKVDQMRKYGPWLAPPILKRLQENPHLAGSPTEPSRFDEAELLDRMVVYGTTEYERQFMMFLDAGVGVNNPLKLRDIPVMELAEPVEATDQSPYRPFKVPTSLTWMPSPQTQYADLKVDSLNGDGHVYAPIAISDMWQEPELKVLIVDPSGGGFDETAWSILTQHLGRVFFPHQDARLEGFSTETMQAIAADAFKWRVHAVHIEKNYGGGMFGELLRPHLMAAAQDERGRWKDANWQGCEIIELNAGQVQKEVRIVDTLTGLVTAHRLVLSAELLRRDFTAGKHYETVEESKRRFYRLTYQLTRITKKRGCLAHDDRIDSLATGVGTFVGVLQRQLHEAAEKAREDYLAGEAEKIHRSLRKQAGVSPQGSRPGLDNFIKFAQKGLSSSPLFKGR